MADLNGGPARPLGPMQWGEEMQGQLEPDEWEFYAEAIQSWRAWRAVELDGVLLLQSITYRDIHWIPRQELVADCKKNDNYKRDYPHCAPSIRHGCGIYSLKNAEDVNFWKNYPTPTDTIIYGRSSIWGNVFKYTKGYISQYAYPSYLFTPANVGVELKHTVSAEELRMELSRTYVVEAEIA